MTRLEQLQQFVKEDPHDPFNFYALALEYSKSDVLQASGYFEILLKQFPEYIATYYHAAGLFEKMGNREKAIATLETGIDKARQQKEHKAQRELQAMYDELTLEY